VLLEREILQARWQQQDGESVGHRLGTVAFRS
jgi:hypothetical protein